LCVCWLRGVGRARGEHRQCRQDQHCKDRDARNGGPSWCPYAAIPAKAGNPGRWNGKVKSKAHGFQPTRE
jgi:hypothetical protein